MSTIAVIVPAAGTNLCSNPSFEVDTAGWSPSGATFTRTAGAGVFGGYGGRLLASVTGGTTLFTAGSVGSTTLVTASAWIKAASNSVVLRLGTNGLASQVAHPGDGAWHRLEITRTTTSSTAPEVAIIDNRSSAWTAVDVDAVMIETDISVASTYVDGAQDGCSWTGTPHGSTSTRNGRDGRGGTTVDLSTIGSVKNFSGIGTPDMNVATTSLAYTDGEIFTRQTAKPRVLMLPVLLAGANLAALHTSRRSLLDLFNADARDGRGAIRLKYSGASTVKLLDCYLETGLGFDLASFTQRNEMVGLRFLCPDPFWYAETETQYALSTVDTIAVSRIALRSPRGVWSGMSGGAANAPTTAAVTAAVRLFDGRIVVGGSVSDFGGGASNDNLAAYTPSTNTWALLGSTTVSAAANCLALGLDGTLYIGGLFTDLGTANGDYVVAYNPVTNTYSALSTGANNNVYALAVDPSTGYLWASGGFTSIGGTASNPGMAYWNGSAWVNANTGLPGGAGATTAQAFTFGPDGVPYLASAETIYRWSGSTWASIGSGSGGSNVNAIMWSAGILYAAGSFTTMGGVTASRIAKWNGTGWSALGSGAGSGILYSLAADGAGNVYVGGYYASSIGGISTPANIAVWNGSAWQAFPATPPVSNTPAGDLYRIFTFNDGSLLLGWSNLASGKTYGANLTAPSITTVTNDGSANAYPVIEFASSGQLYSLANLTTGQQMTFSGLSIAAGETATLDLRPGRKTFKAPLRNLQSTIVAGSDVATFTLAPGANRIAVYALGGTAAMHFRLRSWSAD